MKKEIGLWLVSLVMLFGCFSWVRAAEVKLPAGAKLLFSDDFEKYSSTSVGDGEGEDYDPLKWKVFSETDVRDCQVVNNSAGLPVYSGKNSLRLRDYTDSKRAIGGIYRFFSAKGDVVCCEYYCRAADTKRAATICIRGGDKPGPYITTSGNKFRYYDGSSWQTITEFTLNKWHHIRIVADESTDRFDFYLDDMTTPVGTGLPFREEVASWGRGRLDINYIYKQSAGTVYYDNIVVSTGFSLHDSSGVGQIVFGNLSSALTKEIIFFEEKIKDLKGKIKKENFTEFFTKIDAIGNNLERIKKQVPSKLTNKKDRQETKKEMDIFRSSFKDLTFSFYALKEGYLLWQKNPLASLSRNKIPLNLKQTKEINLIMGMNEEEMVSLVIFNFKDKPLSGRLILSRFKDEKGKSISPDFIDMRTPVFIELRVKKFVDDPIPLLNEVTVASRENKEILFIVDSHKLSPGTYQGIINLSLFEKKTVKTIKFNISVLPVDLKEDHLRFWPYGIFSRDPINGIPEKLLGDYIKDWCRHRGNAFTMASSHVPNPVFDAQKRVKEALNSRELPFFERLLSLIKEYGKEDTMVVVPTFRAGRCLENNGIEYLSAEWKNALKIYFTALIAHLKKLGFSEENIALYPYDEIAGEEKCRKFCEVAKIIKEVNPKIKIFTTQSLTSRQTPGSSSTKKISDVLADIKITAPYVDIWCPWAYIYHPHDLLAGGEKLKLLKKTGKPIWSYNNEIAKQTAPSLIVRRYGWLAWKEGLQGIGSWAYDYWAGNPWDDFDHKRYTMAYVYPGKKGPIPSRRWEAFRDTMEDHELLFSLSSAIKEAKNKKIDTSLSQRLLNEAVNTVSETENPDIISQYKEKILKEIVKLQSL